MTLEKNDLKQIQNIVQKSEERLDKKIDSVKKDIVSVISREINDLAEINREVIRRVDKVDELEKRIIRIEARLDIKPA